MSKLGILASFVKFLAAEKKFWLLPMVVILGLLGALLIATQGSVLAPFIYTLF